MGSGTIHKRSRFWRRTTTEVEDLNFGAATGEGRGLGLATEPAPEMRFTIAEGPQTKVELIEILKGTSAESVRINSNADVLCIDLGNSFTLAEAVDWVTRRQRFAVEQYGGPASIAVLGDAKNLTLDDRRRISWDLEPAGARFSRWPDRCESFREAFLSFGESVKQGYQVPMVVAL